MLRLSSEIVSNSSNSSEISDIRDNLPGLYLHSGTISSLAKPLFHSEEAVFYSWNHLTPWQRATRITPDLIGTNFQTLRFLGEGLTSIQSSRITGDISDSKFTNSDTHSHRAIFGDAASTSPMKQSTQRLFAVDLEKTQLFHCPSLKSVDDENVDDYTLIHSRTAPISWAGVLRGDALQVQPGDERLPPLRLSPSQSVRGKATEMETGHGLPRKSALDSHFMRCQRASASPQSHPRAHHVSATLARCLDAASTRHNLADREQHAAARCSEQTSQSYAGQLMSGVTPAPPASKCTPPAASDEGPGPAECGAAERRTGAGAIAVVRAPKRR